MIHLETKEPIRLVVAVDFDGTIVDHAFPKIGVMKKGAREALQTLKLQGHTIIIWTCRTLPQHIAEAKRWLDEYNIPYDYFNENAPEAPYPCRPKIYADVYIDDRNLCGFIEWWAVPGLVARRVKEIEKEREGRR